jgi:hypothetical protein
VASAVRLAREHDLEIGVRCGSHATAPRQATFTASVSESGASFVPAELRGRPLRRGEPGTVEPRPDLLYRHVPREVGGSMLRLQIPAEWREATVIRRSQSLHRDVRGRDQQLLLDVFGRLDIGREWVITPIKQTCGTPLASSRL